VTKRVRRPAVAGQFYPADPGSLARAVDELLSSSVDATADDGRGDEARCLVVPHAGYVYSGPVAAAAMSRLARRAADVRRVVLVGPAHFVPLEGMAVPSADLFETPLGLVEVDDEARQAALAHEEVSVDDVPHAPEHSLEVILPFLQRVLERFRLLPLVAGRVAPGAVADVLEPFWDDPATVTVVSSDLSHYHDYDTAAALDGRTAALIVGLRAEAIGPEDACGWAALRGALEAGRRRQARVSLLDLRSSGDTAGPRDRVVGYGAFAIESPRFP
jgi:AmmeMemoRadiSam system protein B